MSKEGSNPLPGDFEAFIFHTEKALFGCVVISLESFFGTDATHQEWEQRLAAVRARLYQLNQVNQEAPNPRSRNRLRKEIILADFEDVRKYINTVAGNDSPLGVAIKNSELEHKVQTGAEVLELLANGTELLAMWKMVRKVYGGSIGHMAHLRHSPTEGFALGVSDGIPWRVNNKQAYFTLQRKSSTFS